MNQRDIKLIGDVRCKIFHNIFSEIISLENLFLAWDEFKKGKRNKLDVQEFEYNLENNIFKLHQELKTKTYQHSHYTAFSIQDPKPRKIHKACVKDRVLHHAVFRILYFIFDPTFIFDSYSCRIKKGTHRAVNRLENFCGKLSKNNAKNIFVLKCDIKRFFDSVDQDILLNFIKKKIQDKNIIWLIEKIIKSFEKEKDRGLPLGNVTSQLFANIYLNELDQFVEHKLKANHYIRYCDDFVILSDNNQNLEKFIFQVRDFLKQTLKLVLRPDKIVIRKYHQGIDFLGYVVFQHRRVLRTKTKRRVFRKIKKRHRDLQAGLISEKSFNQSLQSYFGILKHCDGHKIKKQMFKLFALSEFSCQLGRGF